MTYDEEAKDMTSEAAYIPKKEDFVPAPASMRKAVSAEAVRGVKYETLKRFIANKSGGAGVIILMILILLALAGPYLTGHSYDKQDLTRSDLAPRIPVLSSFGILDGSERMDKTSGALVRNKYEELCITDTYYIFGTDRFGRDLFSRCFMGLRISLCIAFLATMINLFIGMNYGVVSGYFGGMTDILMQRIVDVAGSIPTLVVVTLMMLILKPGMGSIILALMVSGWIQMSLIARAETLKVKQLEFVQAAKTMGAGHAYIIFCEIIPNIAGKLITQIMLCIPDAVFLEAFLSFVGLGMPAGACSLGTLLFDGFDSVLLHPYKLIPPAFLMILLMIGCHMVAEGLKESTG